MAASTPAFLLLFQEPVTADVETTAGTKTLTDVSREDPDPDPRITAGTKTMTKSKEESTDTDLTSNRYAALPQTHMINIASTPSWASVEKGVRKHGIRHASGFTLETVPVSRRSSKSAVAGTKTMTLTSEEPDRDDSADSYQALKR